MLKDGLFSVCHNWPVICPSPLGWRTTFLEGSSAPWKRDSDRKLLVEGTSYNSIFQKHRCLFPFNTLRTCPLLYVGSTAVNPMSNSERSKQNCLTLSPASCYFTVSLDLLKPVDNKHLSDTNRKRMLQNPLRSQRLSD